MVLWVHVTAVYTFLARSRWSIDAEISGESGSKVEEIGALLAPKEMGMIPVTRRKPTLQCYAAT